jgi:hypothetical protein
MTLFCIIVNDIHQKRSWKRRDIHTTTRNTLETDGVNFMHGPLFIHYWNLAETQVRVLAPRSVLQYSEFGPHGTIFTILDNPSNFFSRPNGASSR